MQPQPLDTLSSAVLDILKKSSALHGSNKRIIFDLAGEIIVERSGPLEAQDYHEGSLALLEPMQEGFAASRSSEFLKWLIKTFCALRVGEFSSERVPLKGHLAPYLARSKETLSVLMPLRIDVFSKNLFYQCIENKNWTFFVVEATPILYGDWGSQQVILYFEMQKHDHLFNEIDIAFIEDELPALLAGEIEYRRKVRFHLPNRETAIKTLVDHMQKIQLGDPPHVSIDLTAQTFTSFLFSANICVLYPNERVPLKKILAQASLPIIGSTEVSTPEGSKQGVSVLFEIQIESHPTSVEARKKTSRALEKIIGPFRDTNGGLLEKIEQNFALFAALCDDPHYLIRSFLASIIPEERQAVLPPALLLHAYCSLRETEADPEPEPLIFYQEGDRLSICVTLESSTFKAELINFLQEDYPMMFFSAYSTHQRDILCGTIDLSRAGDRLPKEKARRYFNAWLEQAEQKQVIKTASNISFTSFDPRVGTGEETSFLHRLLFSGLTRIGADGKVENALAEKIETAADGMHYRFHLRKSCWSDGSLVTADDFIYSWRASLSPNFFSPLIHFFYTIKNGQKIKEGLLPVDSFGVQSPDPMTIDIFLDYPCPYFLELCAHPAFAPVSMKLDQRDPNWPTYSGRRYICNGQFSLDKVSREDVTLVKNPYYWDSGPGLLEKVEINFMDKERSLILFEKGQLDALFGPISRGDMSKISQGCSAKRWEEATYTKYLFFNCQTFPFSNQKFREAISRVIDRTALAKAHSSGALPHYTPYSTDFTQLSPIDPKNLLQAKKLLKQGLEEGGFPLDVVRRIELHVSEENRPVAELLVGQVNKHLRLQWKVVLARPRDRLRMVAAGQLQVALYDWTNAISNPSYFLDIFSSLKNPTNYSFWGDSRMKEIIDKIRIEKRGARVKKLHKEAERLIWELTPFTPLFTIPSYSLARPCVATPEKGVGLSLATAYKK